MSESCHMKKSRRRGEVMDIWEPSESFAIGMVIALHPRSTTTYWEPSESFAIRMVLALHPRSTAT
jgi:hypothetical protein